MQKSLLTLLSFILLSVSVSANTITVDGETGTTSTYLPVALHTNTSSANYAFHSVSQQLYYASELAGASSTRITAISFAYSGTTFTRKIAVLMNSADYDSFPLPNEGDLDDEANKTPNMVNPGTRVFSGDVSMVDGESYTITFDTPYDWNGTSNIIVTVLDSTAKKNSKTYYPDATIYTVAVRIFETSGKVRFLHKTSKDQSDYANKGWDMNNLAAAKANSSSVDNRKYANRITFTFAAAVIPPATPSDLAVSETTASSATLAWSAVEGATSYDLQQSADGENWSALASGVTGTSYNWTGLSAESTQYARICAKNANGSSSWSEAVTVATDAVHEHNGITFDKWSSTNSLPAEAGNYYLNADVVLPYYYSVPGNINLCLNGHSIYTYYYNIVVPDEKTLAIYDNVGGGRIYGYYVGDNGSYYGLVSIADGGTFVLNGGSVENLADDFNNAGEVSYGIYNNGILKLSGAPAIIGYHGDIYLGSSKYITIESGKPLTNTTPYSLFKLTIGPFTIGWANMNGAKPSAHFTPKNEFHGVCYNSGTGEAEVVRVFSTSDNNASIKAALENGTYKGTLLNFKITSRSFTSTQYNTICLPFALSNAQLEDVFGEGYDLEEFDHSNLVGDALELVFAKRTSLIEGEPYLIKPTIDVVNPVFDGVTFYISEPGEDDLDEYVDFQGTFGPTELEGGNKNLLFLGAGNELFWPATTANIKGFRAYFEVKPSAGAAKRARIVKKEEGATGMDQITNDKLPMTNKILRNGQLLILRDNKTYNVLGMEYK